MDDNLAQNASKMILKHLVLTKGLHMSWRLKTGPDLMMEST